MQNRHPLVTFSYHLLSEGIIIFLVILPLLYYVFDWVPYLGYLVTLIGVSLLYTILFWKFNHIFLYVMTYPLLVGLFHILHYPLVITLAVPFLLVWRAIDIRTKMDDELSREQIYILLTLLLSTILVLFIRDGQIIIYAFSQFLLLILGNIVSHITVIDKSDRQKINHKLWLYITGLLVGGIAIVYPLFLVGRSVLIRASEWFVDGFIYLAGKMGSLLWFLDPNIKRRRSTYRDDEVRLNPPRSENRGHDRSGFFEEYVLPSIFWLFIVVLIAVIIYIGYRIYQHRKIVKLHSKESEMNASIQKLPTEALPSISSVRNRFQRMFRKPDHPIRKLLYQFEVRLTKRGFGRQPHETIENWFTRLQLSDYNIQIYQKVRYGGEEVSEEEVRSFKKNLQQINEQLNQNLKKDKQ